VRTTISSDLSSYGSLSRLSGLVQNFNVFDEDLPKRSANGMVIKSSADL
jgi:hypothetical protein